MAEARNENVPHDVLLSRFKAAHPDHRPLEAASIE
jgi:hypothetical protein